MKLVKALELAEECGLHTVFEAIYNVYLHASQLFAFGEMSKEYDELMDEWTNFKAAHTEFDTTSSVRKVLKCLRKEMED